MVKLGQVSPGWAWQHAAPGHVDTFNSERSIISPPSH
jgi:hypothetical protein